MRCYHIKFIDFRANLASKKQRGREKVREEEGRRTLTTLTWRCNRKERKEKERERKKERERERESKPD